MIENHELSIRSWPSVWSADNTRFYLELKEFENTLQSRLIELEQKEKSIYQDGFKAGYQDGKKSQIKDFSAVYSEFLRNFEGQLKEELPQLVSQIIKKIVSIELYSNSSTVLSVIEQIARKFTIERPVKIIITGPLKDKVNPEYFNSLFPGGCSVEYLPEGAETTITLETMGQKIQFSPEFIAGEVRELLE
ncbi:hypothetical protein KKF34_00095 [Myxococcota bacterium]|nr:hypothetical protein [Myxococcota bacterium]MBU1379542.1 hypothetical protein [Myxococcota bacterium]MBU1495260.1 hypothetical protein [Myxococcota bacterium]